MRRAALITAMAVLAAHAARAYHSAVPRTPGVRMQGGQFSPAQLTVDRGDTVRFVLGSGGPHNVAFRETKGDAAAKLRARMGRDTIADLSGPLLVIPGETYVIAFDVPAGSYPYWCIPHLAGGMMGTITVR
jgi:plastocyanin